MTTSRLFNASLIASQIRQWIRTDCLNVSALLLPLLLLLHLLLPVTTRENGMGILARDQLQFSHRFSSERLTVIRVPVSTLQAATGRADIEGTSQSATTVTDTTVASVTRVAVKDASRWVMRPKIVEALDLRIRISSSHQHSRISNRATGDVFIVALKVTSKDTDLS